MLRVAKEQQEEIDAEDRSRRGPSSEQVNPAPFERPPGCVSFHDDSFEVRFLRGLLKKENGLQGMRLRDAEAQGCRSEAL